MFGKATSPNSATVDNSAQDIPEWKKLLLMKKRTGNAIGEEIKQEQARSHFLGPVSSSAAPTESVAGRRANSSSVPVNSTCDSLASGPANKFSMSRPSRCLDTWEQKAAPSSAEIQPDKVVRTIGNIKVELRSVHKISPSAEAAYDEDCFTSPVSEQACPGPTTVGDSDDDNEEDLQYGPGIVDKLRARFLSLEARNRRKPVVRKFSSLENLTGGSAFRANGGYQPRGEKRFGMRAARSCNVSHKGSNFKKAQSMETLLVGSADCGGSVGRRVLGARVFGRTTTLASPSLMSNSIAKEKSPSPVSKYFEPCRFGGSKVEYSRQSSAPSINEDELPRPDTVKQVKRMFESPSAEDKMCHGVAINHSANENRTTGGQPLRPASVLGASSTKQNSAILVNAAGKKHVVNAKSSSEKSIAKPSAKESDSSPCDFSPAYPRDIVCEESARIPSPTEREDGQREPSPVTVDEGRDFITDTVNNEDLFISGVPRSPIDTLEARNPDVRAKPADVLSENREFLEAPPTSKVTPDRLPQVESSSDEEDSDRPQGSQVLGGAEPVEAEAVVAVIEDKPHPEVKDKTPNGEVMVVAASQAEDRLRSPDEPKPRAPTARKPSNWQKPPSATTSIVFDFRGKDVKPNISLSPTPFGCKPAKVKKRAGSPPRTGAPRVNGSGYVDEKDNDEDEEDWDETDIGADLPAVSGIVFAGENVKVGRGALLERRNKNLTIQFDDAATSTYEYPCESPDSENGHSPLESHSQNSGSLKSSLVTGSCSGLSSYMPHVLNNSESFQLGVSRPPVLRYTPSMPKNNETQVASVDEIVPATPEDSSGWSSTDSADILF